MSNKHWKNVERRHARRLGSERIPVTGERDGADFQTPLLSVQVKYGRRRPGYLKSWLDGIRATAAKSQRTGIVIWTVKRERSGEALVVMTQADFEALHGRISAKISGNATSADNTVAPLTTTAD